MIRPLIAADLPAIKQIIDATELFPSDMLDQMTESYLDNGAGRDCWLVTTEAEIPLGVAYYAAETLTTGTWNLYLIAVHPKAQRRGIGRALVTAIECQLAKRGERVLLIETSAFESFAGQRLFYNDLGYHEEARVRDFYQAGEDKIIFWKTLNLVLRAADENDLLPLQVIEQEAALAYSAFPETCFCLDLPVRDAGEHANARQHGLALVGMVSGDPVGFLLAVPKDHRVHVLEVAVAKAYQNRGYGRRLMAEFEAWAHHAGFNEATLTTFRDVPWNAPFYNRLGYHVINVEQDRPDLAAVILEEQRAGFHQAPRVVMQKPLQLATGLSK